MVSKARCRGDDRVELRAGTQRGREGGQGGASDLQGGQYRTRHLQSGQDRGEDECETDSKPNAPRDEDGGDKIDPKGKESHCHRESQDPATVHPKESSEDLREFNRQSAERENRDAVSIE